jgi:hypothetical protein
MMKPVSEWDEAYVLALAKENNEFERKSSKKLDITLPGVDENEVLNELAKQLSAFANMGGGKVVYGIKDDGTSDGGVSKEMKRGGTAEWLERQIPLLTEFEIMGVNVFEIVSTSSESQIAPGKAIYVIDVPDSDRAPHQSRRDSLYYVRFGSQSRPAPHRIIEDIRNRQKHAVVEWSEIRMEDARVEKVPNKHVVQVDWGLVLFNRGPLKSVDTLISFKPSHGYVRDQANSNLLLPVYGTKGNLSRWSLHQSLLPGSELDLRFSYETDVIFGPAGGRINMWHEPQEWIPIDDLTIEWTITSDSAPLKKETIRMGDHHLNALLGDPRTGHLR